MMFIAQESNISHRSPNVIYMVVLTKSFYCGEIPLIKNLETASYKKLQ
jgi:hypothetical protein